jgi:hypothetical protein
MLLNREALSVPAAVERLVGMQAQLPVAPYVGLWTRLPDFKRADLAARIEDRSIVKGTLMRATLHLFTVQDYLRLRAALQPALDRGLESITKRRGRGLNFERVLAAAEKFIAEQPRTFAEISAMLSELMPEGDVGAMRYAVRMRLPMVQVPITSGWSYPGNPKFTLAKDWLGQPIPLAGEPLRTLLVRYLAAFGPATIADFQTWSGLAKTKEAIERLKPDLCTYRDELGRELLDLPEMPLPDADTPAPVRFLPDFDNLLLGHDNRTRVISEPYREKVFLSGLRVASTFLVDGFVRGVWKIEKEKGTAALVIEPLEPLAQPDHDALADEAERLIRFLEPDAKAHEVRFAE